MSFIEIEKLTLTENWSMHKAHMHPFYELYFLEQGTREYTIGEEVFQVESGSFVMIAPNTFHKTEGGPFSRINLNFDEEYLDFFDKDDLKSLFQKKAVKIPPESMPAILSIIDNIANMYEASRDVGDKKLKIAVHYLLMELDKISQNASPLFGKIIPDTTIRKAIALIEKEYQTCSLSSVSLYCCVSDAHMCRKFKKMMGINIRDYILNKKIAQATALLKSTNMPMDTVAEACGFSSANYFGMMFKKKVGMSPQHFRKTYY